MAANCHLSCKNGEFFELFRNKMHARTKNAYQDVVDESPHTDFPATIIQCSAVQNPSETGTFIYKLAAITLSPMIIK